MRVLVTGASGYLGSRLVRAFAAEGKWKVCALLRPSSNADCLAPFLERIDVQRSSGFHELVSVMKRVRPDVVVHLAACGSRDSGSDRPEDVLSANVTFGTLLLQAMSEAGVSRLVNTGTFWEQMDGNSVYRPLDLYAASKRAFQEIIRYYEDAHGLKAVTLRLFGVYGPHDPRAKFFSLFRKSLSEETPVALSPGGQELDLVYADDVVEAYAKAVDYVAAKEDSAPETFEIGSGACASLRAIAGIYEECAGRTLNVTWGGVPYRRREVMRSRADLSSAATRLGWEPRHDLRAGITKMLEAESQPAS